MIATDSTKKIIEDRRVQNVVFTNDWHIYFRRFGLRTLKDFYNFSVVYKPNQMATKKAVVINFCLGNNQQQKSFFIKWYLRVPWKNTWKTWRKFRNPYSQARAEMETAHRLVQHGISTYKPVCYGEEMGLLFEKRSFLVTEKISQPSLAEYIFHHWLHWTEQEREKLITSLARFTRKMHDKGIRFPDLYTKHIFVNSSGSGEYHFTLIDLQRISEPDTDYQKRIQDLGALHHSLPTKIVDQHYRQMFVYSYLGNDSPDNVKVLLHLIQKRSRHLDRHRRFHWKQERIY